jgi:transaldolase
MKTVDFSQEARRIIVATPLQELAEHGQSPWVDYLSRPFVRDGELARLIGAGVLGVTSNPTIFQGAIAEGDAYDMQLREILRTQTDPKEIFLELAADDVRGACDLLRPHAEASTGRPDGWVSLEVDPRLAYDAEATVAEAVRLHTLIDRHNLFVKIPGTEPGLTAIEETVARGIPVNVTLLFSLTRHEAAMRAYQRGLRRLRDAGGDLSKVASVASFFVSRVDTEADHRIDQLGTHDELKGTLAVANAKLAYRNHQQQFAGAEWDELAAAGATPQYCLWASTSMKDPTRRDVSYVEQLIGPDTVNTMPRQTISAFAEHGRVADTLTENIEDAYRTMSSFRKAGIDYQDVVDVLERQGVDQFAESFQQLFDGIERKRDKLFATGKVR